MTKNSRREVLGIAVQPSEAEVFWDEFLRSLADPREAPTLKDFVVKAEPLADRPAMPFLMSVAPQAR